MHEEEVEKAERKNSSFLGKKGICLGGYKLSTAGSPRLNLQLSQAKVAFEAASLPGHLCLSSMAEAETLRVEPDQQRGTDHSF